MAKKTKMVEVVSDGSEKFLVELVERFSVKRAIEWLRVKFPSFDTSRAEELACDATKNEKEYFDKAELLGYVTKLNASASDDSNKPILVAAVKMRKDLTERTSRLVQFNYAKKLLQNAIAKGAQGVSGLPSQGLFFFYDKDGFFRLSLVTGEVEKRRFKYNEAKRQSFYIEPLAANNIVKRRLSPPIKTFAELKDVFSVEQLTKEFYTKLFDWYTWALTPKVNVSFPNDLDDDKDDRKYNNEAIIRMITRLMFTWFIRQRKLVPDVLFDREGLKDVLKNFDADSMEQDNYYRAILQNLFFATFNCPQSGKGKLTRRWIDADVNNAGNGVGLSSDYHVTTVYRYKNEFRKPDEFLELMKKVPFLNCALFDCLDKVERKVDGGRKLYFDGFSTKRKRQAFVPNGLFFDGERGIINLFNLYEFTVNENNADDSDVALDPELLGKVFENLLGAFNPETQETARNATGSFYTPREIVDYMVEESLKNYLKTKVPAADDARLDDLFDRNKAAEGAETLFSSKERGEILDALYGCKILDPACGSGAFPMGILHCMVRLLTRLDPQCISIREQLLARYKEDKATVDPSETDEERRERLEELEEGQHYPDYERKLYLIENCIYGVDIQPIATQISKLRFFISLLCDQLRSSYDPDAENFGLLSLPNLEAKFVCANTLISLPDIEGELKLGDVKELRDELQANRHKIFRARSTKTKEKYKRRDLEIRDAIRETVKDTLSKPDELVIAKCREQIADAKERRKAVAEPDWHDEDIVVQDDFFSDFKSKRVRKDWNEPKRSKIDGEIEWAEKKIKEELAKGEKSNVSAAAQYAGMVAGWDPYDQNASSKFFDAEWMFNIKNGFDVVIGNPPYVRVANDDEYAQYYKQRYVIGSCGRTNLYKIFMERGIRLLKDGGAFAYITPNSYIADGSDLLRDYLLNRKIIEIIEYTEKDRVFENVAQAVATTIIVNEKPPQNHNCRIVTAKQGDCIVEQTTLSNNAGSRLIAASPIILKLRSAGHFLTEWFDIFQGEINLTAKAAYYGEKKVRDTLPMWRGDNVGAFNPASLPNDYCKLNATDRSHHGVRRIVMKQITNQQSSFRTAAFISPIGYFCGNSTNYLKPQRKGIPLEAFVGLINSKVFNYQFSYFSFTNHITTGELSNVVVPSCEALLSSGLDVLVKRRMAADNHDAQKSLEDDIDSVVYKTYGLTEDDIAVIEGRGTSDGTTTVAKGDRIMRHCRLLQKRNDMATTPSQEEEELE